MLEVSNKQCHNDYSKYFIVLNCCITVIMFIPIFTFNSYYIHSTILGGKLNWRRRSFLRMQVRNYQAKLFDNKMEKHSNKLFSWIDLCVTILNFN